MLRDLQTYHSRRYLSSKQSYLPKSASPALLHKCHMAVIQKQKWKPSAGLWVTDKDHLSIEVFLNNSTDISSFLSITQCGFQRLSSHPCFLHPKRKTQVKSQYFYDIFADCSSLNWSLLFLNAIALTAYFKYFSFKIIIKHLLCVPKKQKSIHQFPIHNQRLKKVCICKLKKTIILRRCWKRGLYEVLLKFREWRPLGWVEWERLRMGESTPDRETNLGKNVTHSRAKVSTIWLESKKNQVGYAPS